MWIPISALLAAAGALSYAAALRRTGTLIAQSPHQAEMRLYERSSHFPPSLCLASQFLVCVDLKCFVSVKDVLIPRDAVEGVEKAGDTLAIHTVLCHPHASTSTIAGEDNRHKKENLVLIHGQTQCISFICF